MSKPTSSKSKYTKPFLVCFCLFFLPLTSHYTFRSSFISSHSFQFHLTSRLWVAKLLTTQRLRKRSTTFVTSEWRRNWSERARALVKRLLYRPRTTPGTRFSFSPKYTGECCFLANPDKAFMLLQNIEQNWTRVYQQTCTF